HRRTGRGRPPSRRSSCSRRGRSVRLPAAGGTRSTQAGSAPRSGRSRRPRGSPASGGGDTPCCGSAARRSGSGAADPALISHVLPWARHNLAVADLRPLPLRLPLLPGAGYVVVDPKQIGRRRVAEHAGNVLSVLAHRPSVVAEGV